MSVRTIIKKINEASTQKALLESQRAKMVRNNMDTTEIDDIIHGWEEAIEQLRKEYYDECMKNSREVFRK